MKKLKTRKNNFVHLHTHTEFSFLDGSANVNDLVKKVAATGGKAVAMTEHGNIFGFWRFQKACKEYGVKAIFGCEFYVAEDRHRHGLTEEEKKAALEGVKAGDKRKVLARLQAEFGTHTREHVVLLAQNQNGLQSIIRLVEESYRFGFYYKPRIDRKILQHWVKDCFVLSACMQGMVAQALRKGGMKEGLRCAMQLKKWFGKNFFIEIQPNEIAEQRELNLQLVKIARQTGIGLVATNDVHYVEAEDFSTHDVLMVCRHNADKEEKKAVTVQDTDRFKYDTQRLFVMTEEEVAQSFKTYHADLPEDAVHEAMRNTKLIADQCNAEIKTHETLLPEVTLPKGFESKREYFEHLIEEGWQRRRFDQLEKDTCEKYKQRLQTELAQLYRVEVFTDYFLIVHDLIAHAKSLGIRVGPGRGSAAGALVSYLLGITEVDPVKWGLMFERFISPARIDLPDIDLDFEKERREEVKQYLRKKYGEENVGTICTFGTFGFRLVLKDVARAHGVDWRETNIVTDFVLPVHQRTEDLQNLEDIFTQFEDCKRYRDKYPEVVKHALKLEGNVKQLGTGAAGVVVSPVPLKKIVPVFWSGGELLTGFDKDDCEEIGLLKLDVLGLNTLTIISKTLELIEVNNQQHADQALEEIYEALFTGDFDDPEVYKELVQGNTTGVFQFDTPGARRVLREIKPQNFKELMAAAALDRPGTLQSGMTKEYIARKEGGKKVEVNPVLADILEETFGVMVYQEQLVRIVHDIGGLNWSEADNVRKAVGKKKPELLAKFKKQFIEGAIEKGFEKTFAADLWSAINFFGGYGFNKSHSAAYGLIAYQTAWLKVHFALEFMTAALACEENHDNYSRLVKEAKRLGVKVLPPDVNKSAVTFIVDEEADNAVRVGLRNIAGIGEKAAAEIMRKRPFTSFNDFLKRIERRSCNKTVITALLQVGAFGDMAPDPAALIENLAMHQKKADQQLKHEAGKRTGKAKFKFKRVKSYTEGELAQMQDDLLKFALADHAVKRLNIAEQFALRFNTLDQFEEVYADDPAFAADDKGEFKQIYLRQFIFAGVVTKCQVSERDGEEAVAKLTVEDDTDFATVFVPVDLLDSIGGQKELIEKRHVIAFKCFARGSLKFYAREVADLTVLQDTPKHELVPGSFENQIVFDPLKKLQPVLADRGFDSIKSLVHGRKKKGTVAGRIFFAGEFVAAKSKKKYLRFTLEDSTLNCEVYVWSDKIRLYKDLLTVGNLVGVRMTRLHKSLAKKAFAFQLSNDDKTKKIASVFSLKKALKK